MKASDQFWIVRELRVESVTVAILVVMKICKVSEEKETSWKYHYVIKRSKRITHKRSARKEVNRIAL